jgi:F0F1-type ATP synthase assembly protein I
MTSPPDGRSPAAKAAEWSTRIMTISLEMVLPGLVGYWIDTKLGTWFVFMLAGFVLGFVTAIKHLLYFTRKAQQRRSDDNSTNSNNSRGEQDL